MITKYQYINFKVIEKKPKTEVWQCCNNQSGQELGVVKWHFGWRRYCYFPTVQAVYSAGCLENMSEFIKQLSLPLPDPIIHKKKELAKHGMPTMR